MNIQDLPLSQILSDRQIFGIFDEEFQKETTWLDVSGLIQSESTIRDLYRDEIVPKQTLDRIVEALQSISVGGQEEQE